MRATGCDSKSKNKTKKNTSKMVITFLKKMVINFLKKNFHTFKWQFLRYDINSTVHRYKIYYKLHFLYTHRTHTE